MMPGDRCVKCGGPRDWAIDTVFQDLCYNCGRPRRPEDATSTLRGRFTADMPIDREAIEAALEYWRTHPPTLEDLALLAQLSDRRRELRMEEALEDPRKLQEALVEDLGTILASLDMPIEPYRTSWTDIIRERMRTDPRFLSTLRAFLHLVTGWIDAERNASYKIAAAWVDKRPRQWEVAASIADEVRARRRK